MTPHQVSFWTDVEERNFNKTESCFQFAERLQERQYKLYYTLLQI